MDSQHLQSTPAHAPTTRRACWPGLNTGAAMLLAAVAAASSPAQAGSLSLQGLLQQDSSLVGVRLQLDRGDMLSVRSLGWGGGTLADGQVVAGGGFATVLSLFDGDGDLIAFNAGSSMTCGAPGAGKPDSLLGFCWDAVLRTPLAAGLYTLILSQDGNLPLGHLADGFSEDGDYTAAWLGAAARPGDRFIDITGTPRDGHWALDIHLDHQTVPEPDPLALLATAALAALLSGRRRTFSRPQ